MVDKKKKFIEVTYDYEGASRNLGWSQQKMNETEYNKKANLIIWGNRGIIILLISITSLLIIFIINEHLLNMFTIDEIGNEVCIMVGSIVIIAMGIYFKMYTLNKELEWDDMLPDLKEHNKKD